MKHLKYLITRGPGRVYRVSADVPLGGFARDLSLVDGVGRVSPDECDRYAVSVQVGDTFDVNAVLAAVVVKLADLSGSVTEPYAPPEPPWRFDPFKVPMAHDRHLDYVTFRRDTDRPGPAMAQLRAALEESVNGFDPGPPETNL